MTILGCTNVAPTSGVDTGITAEVLITIVVGIVSSETHEVGIVREGILAGLGGFDLTLACTFLGPDNLTICFASTEGPLPARASYESPSARISMLPRTIRKEALP